MTWLSFRAQNERWNCRAGQDASQTIAIADTASKIDAAGCGCVPTPGNSALKVKDQTVR